MDSKRQYSRLMAVWDLVVCGGEVMAYKCFPTPLGTSGSYSGLMIQIYESL